ncbi:rhomboid family intramembrane serine protease [Pseudodesulfovibrio piezophilus]|uniref:Rhomboid family protein n=1 Tax=Pseudodesulfovibrio piezophilus (strain DSM 21447 / JCM 15486 / C1TLV30) TaxID=1322246 RepID=M1WVN7_PSEP2|nr:rhomboid family intramembrane serine protease [Pseudodesulfovibrio piezophilus]CCH48638.1 Rhomboid family protein [Pseudodesulfovibrio piezophilus C1TLV30]
MPNTLFHDFLSHYLRSAWVNIVPRVFEDEENVGSLALSTAQLWALVLASRHIPCRISRLTRTGEQIYVVQVSPWFADQAIDEILLYMEENAPDEGAGPPSVLSPISGPWATITAMLGMVLFFWVYGRTYPALALHPGWWLSSGSADAGRILGGEWWRVLTALTLHADGAHVMGNALIGGVFVWLVACRLGSGLAWIMTILGGGLGNILNSLALAAPHDAIGFSTAVFAAAGLLAGISPFGIGGGIHGFGTGACLRRFSRFIGSAVIPVAAGLGLLAMLGAGENTDLGGHFFGFVSGLGLGFIVGLTGTRRGVPSRRIDGILFACAMTLPLLAWVFAWLA